MLKKVTIICHDENAMTYDIINLKDMQDGLGYIDSISDKCDYDKYADEDIADLTSKIEDEWNNIKEKINYIIENHEFEKAFKMNGFCMIIEK